MRTHNSDDVGKSSLMMKPLSLNKKFLQATGSKQKFDDGAGSHIFFSGAGSE